MPTARAASTVRIAHLTQFYTVLERLRQGVGGARLLSECTGRMDWPSRGVYFFYEPNEIRSDSDTAPRVVRVGTHALTSSSRTTLWNRLSSHRGVAASGRGNHRGSIFRLLVGTALMRRQPSCAVDTWGQGSSADRDTRNAEGPLEHVVSGIIGRMPLLWLRIDDPPGPGNQRAYIERNSIGLLSNFNRVPCDPSSPVWLGRQCDRPKVRHSSLRNQQHVEDTYDPAFLDAFDRLVDEHLTAVPSDEPSRRNPTARPAAPRGTGAYLGPAYCYGPRGRHMPRVGPPRSDAQRLQRATVQDTSQTWGPPASRADGPASKHNYMFSLRDRAVVGRHTHG